jgi:hypothetical protein
MLSLNNYKSYDNEIDILYHKYLKEKKEIENKRYKEICKNTKLKDLKKQAYLNYIINYSKLKKMDLIKKIEYRIKKEKILSLDKNIFDICLNYLERNDKINLRKTCKTSKFRVEKINKPGNNIDKYLNVTIKNPKINMYYINELFKLYPENEYKKEKIIIIIKNYLDIIKQTKKNNNKKRRKKR